MTMNNDFFAALFQTMDVAVCEALQDGTFELLGAAPDWLSQFESASCDHEITAILPQHSPFLEDFLVYANEAWQNKNAAMTYSGPWIEVAKFGTEYSLEASALYHQGKSILCIHHLGNTYRQHAHFLQVGRESLIANELLEKEIRVRTEKIRDREQEIAVRLLSAAEYRDEETGAHIRRIGSYAAVLGAALGWNEDRIDIIRVAAPMHDLGKIGIADEILLKPGKLNAEEYSIMQQHAEIGGSMLDGSDIPILKMASEIAYSHHEKWDGSGYPKGLSGKDIPIAGRIVAIADVYDALSHKRCYKAAVPEEQVIEHLVEQSGQHFDPQLVQLFMQNIDEIQSIRREIQD